MLAALQLVQSLGLWNELKNCAFLLIVTQHCRLFVVLPSLICGLHSVLAPLVGWLMTGGVSQYVSGWTASIWWETGWGRTPLSRRACVTAVISLCWTTKDLPLAFDYPPTAGSVWMWPICDSKGSPTRHSWSCADWKSVPSCRNALAAVHSLLFLCRENTCDCLLVRSGSCGHRTWKVTKCCI